MVVVAPRNTLVVAPVNYLALFSDISMLQNEGDFPVITVYKAIKIHFFGQDNKQIITRRSGSPIQVLSEWLHLLW